MRLRSLLLTACFAAGIGAAAIASDSPAVTMSGHEQWSTMQPGNFQQAVLYGNPDSTGFYVVRLKVPANWSFPVHSHPARENVTVISGTFYAGIGTKFDKAKAMAYPAGSFISLPANLPHFAFTTTGGAVIQLEGMGPLKNNMMK